MRRRGVLLVAALLLLSPVVARAVTILPTITVTGTGVYDPIGLFTGDVAALTVADAPRNNGTYLPDPSFYLGPVQVFADIPFQFLFTMMVEDAASEPGRAPFTNPDTGAVFAMPYYFLQMGLGTFTMDTPGVINGVGIDFKNDPLVNIGERSPFFTFFGIDAPDELYNFQFLAVSDVGAAGGYTFTLTNTPVPEPGTMALLATGLFALVGIVRRRRAKP